jgi:hypothetical protein
MPTPFFAPLVGKRIMFATARRSASDDCTLAWPPGI